MSLADEVLAAWAPIMRKVELVSGEKGRFEVSLDGELVFSKQAEGRFPARHEVKGAFQRKLGPPLHWRKA